MAVCLVTGGAGFIGSHLVDELVARGDRVRVIDSFRTGALDNLARSRHHVDLCFGDLTNLALLRKVMQGVDYVFHHAAPPVWENDASESLAAPQSGLTNLMHVLLAAREAQVRRVVYASTCEVYGIDVSCSLSEAHDLHPVSASGVT